MGCISVYDIKDKAKGRTWSVFFVTPKSLRRCTGTQIGVEARDPSKNGFFRSF